MAYFVYNAELKLDRNHVLKSKLSRRLESHFIPPSELIKVRVRHHTTGSFYESGHLDEIAKAMGQQISNSLPSYKLPSGILLEQSFSPELKYILVKDGEKYNFITRRNNK